MLSVSLMGVHKKFPNIHGKTPVSESLFTKVEGLNPCNFIKRRLRHRYLFPRETFFKENLRWLLLTVLWVLPRRITESSVSTPPVKELIGKIIV